MKIVLRRLDEKTRSRGKFILASIWIYARALKAHFLALCNVHVHKSHRKEKKKFSQLSSPNRNRIISLFQHRKQASHLLFGRRVKRKVGKSKKHFSAMPLQLWLFKHWLCEIRSIKSKERRELEFVNRTSTSVCASDLPKERERFLSSCLFVFEL